jgi:putative ABC transport system permease protein
MKLQNLIKLSGRNFTVRPLRTFLTILGVSVGIGTILFLVSLGYGIQKIILDRITTSDSLLSLEISPGPSEIIKLTPDKIEEIKAIPEVVEISPVVSYSGQINYNNLTGDGVIYGADTSYFSLSGIVPKSGKVYDVNSTDGAVITTAGINLLNLTEADAIGKELSLVFFVSELDENGFEQIKIIESKTKYKITGIIEANDSNYIFVPLASLSDIAITDYNRLQIKIADSQYMEKVREEIINKGFMVSALSDVIDQANKIFNIIQIVLLLFGLVALIISAIGMFNTMTIALLERINEIGIMRAIGATSSNIRWLFIIESTIMGFLGGLGGVIVGIVGGKLVNIGLNFLAKSFGGQAVNLFFSPNWFILFIIIFSALVGLLTGLYPSKKAANLNPLDALRYK